MARNKYIAYRYTHNLGRLQVHSEWEYTKVLSTGIWISYSFSCREKELAIWELEILLIVLFLLYVSMPKRHFVLIYTGNERNIKSTDAIPFNWEHFTWILCSKVQEISITLNSSVQPNRFRFQKHPVPLYIVDSLSFSENNV